MTNSEFFILDKSGVWIPVPLPHLTRILKGTEGPAEISLSRTKARIALHVDPTSGVPMVSGTEELAAAFLAAGKSVDAPWWRMGD